MRYFITLILICCTTFSYADGGRIVGNRTITGDLTVEGDDITMTTNTDRFVLMGDGTNYNPEAIDLGTDTTGNYAAGDAEAGAATSGDSATSFFSSGTIEKERLPDASTTADGVVELTIASEVNTGTSATLAITPDSFAGSNAGIRYAQMVCFDFTTDVATGDGKFYIHIPAGLDGMDLVEVHAEVITAGTTGTTDIQIHNVDNALDMLSTKLTIDSGETGSDTAATPAVINTSNDHVNENDVARIDVDAVSTTAPKGLIVTLGFRIP